MNFAFDFIIFGSLITISYIDIKRLIIPDFLSLLIGCLAAIMAYCDGGDRMLDAALGCGLAFLLFEVTRRFMSGLLKREAMGFGDVKLMAAGGLWVGAQSLSLAILTACFAALIGFLIHGFIHRSYVKHTEMPFGPFLAFGLVVSRVYYLFPFGV